MAEPRAPPTNMGVMKVWISNVGALEINLCSKDISASNEAPKIKPSMAADFSDILIKHPCRGVVRFAKVETPSGDGTASDFRPYNFITQAGS